MMKRFYLSLAAVGATAALLTAGSFALFTANTNNVNNTFTAGTVTLGTAASTLVVVNPIAPGDSGTGNYTVTYTGNLSAWLGVNTTLTGDLTTCEPGKFTATVNGVSAAAAGTTLVSGVPVAGGTTVTLPVTWNLDLSTGNLCQGKSAAVAISVKAVQSANNPLVLGQPIWN